MKNSTATIGSLKASTGRKLVLIVFLAVLLMPMDSAAQCAMCRAVLESSGENSMAEGINDGIVYLMAIPYILVAVLFYFVYRKIRS
ncbi:MAG: hypothetical protein ACR2MM_11405 [Flavobacteriaceae bacterium]